MNNNIDIKLDLEAEETIKKLEKIKRLLQDIGELDNNITLSNVLEIDKNSMLVFKTTAICKREAIDYAEKDLADKTGVKCIILPSNLELDKAIKLGIDYTEAKDYTTTQYFTDGELIREETIQYK